MLEINNIRKTYNNGRGLGNLTLNVEIGEVVGIVGPNGSGKSTALNIIAGILKNDGGFCRINGIDTYEMHAKAQIGFLEEEAFCYDDISLINFLNFIWGIKYPNQSNEEVYRLIKAFDLFQFHNNRMKELSMGMKKRVGIISAIMNYPPLIVLDEPTNGIDTKSLIVLKDELLLAKRQSVIIVSGHVLDFIKAVATKVVFFESGAIVKSIDVKVEMNLDDVYRQLYFNR